MSEELEDFEWMLAAKGSPGQMRKIVERERAKMSENLGTLEKTIAAHAAMPADKEWNNEHKPILMSLWTHFELAFATPGGDLTQMGTLEVDGREIPVESITKALHDRFMERRKKTLAKKLTERLVAEVFSMMRTNRKATNEVLPEHWQTTTPKRAVGPDARGITVDRPWDGREGVQVPVVRRLSRIVAPCLGMAGTSNRIRAKQIKMAVNGVVPMSIWVGKNQLGKFDTSTTNVMVAHANDWRPPTGQLDLDPCSPANRAEL